MADGIERTIFGAVFSNGFWERILKLIVQMINFLLLILFRETFEYLKDGFWCNEADKCGWFKR